MPRKKANELLAGLFVVAALAILLGVVLWLGAADLLKTRGQTVTFYVPQAQGSVGVVRGAEVTYGDGRIGKVISVEPAPDKKLCYYRARLERTDVTIRKDGVAVVVSPAVGQAKVVIKDFGRAAEPADDAHPILLSGGLDQVMQQISGLADRVRDEMDPNNAASVLAQVHGVIAGLNGAAKDIAKIAASVRAETDANSAGSLLATIRKSAANIDKATANLARQTGTDDANSIVAKIVAAADHIRSQTDPAEKGSLMAKAHGTVDEVGAMVKNGRPKVDRALTAVANAAEQIEALTKKDLKDILAGLREVNTKILKVANDMTVVSEQAKEIVALNRDNIDETLDNLAQVSVNLKSASKEVRRNPWRLLYQPDDKEYDTQNLLDAVRAFSDGAEQLDQAVAKLRALKKLDLKDPAARAAGEKIHKQLEEAFTNFSKVEQALYKQLEKQ
jgi:ABC-type transporter Mla subunit MlaD